VIVFILYKVLSRFKLVDDKTKAWKIKTVELLEKIPKEIVEIKANAKVAADFATLRSEIINRTKRQQSIKHLK
jgi:hypothetical protein